MRFLLALALLAAGCTPALAASSAAAIAAFGLVGTWSDDCAHDITAERPGFRFIVATPPGAAPTYITTSSDAGIKMTIRSQVISVVPGSNRITLRLRIIGGDRDGWPLPSMTTSTFEQTFETVGPNAIRMRSGGSDLLARCRD